MRRTREAAAWVGRAVSARPALAWWAFALFPAAALLIAGFERRWLDDDGFINLRIVRNWLGGHGLVYNVDERVEASTSPLWIFVLAALGRLGVRLEYAAVFGGIALSVAGLLLAERAASRLHRRALLVPMGAMVLAALPPAWDYASSGLETGLGLAWMGASYLAVARRCVGGGPRGDFATAVLVGAGPLVRPEFALYAAAFFVPFAWVAARDDTAAPVRVRWARLAAMVLAAGSLPLAYLAFRMGYYAAVVPNTALAKEAFAGNFSQGGCYFRNFAETYGIGYPLAGMAPFWLLALHAARKAGKPAALALLVTPAVAAVVHVFYLVAIGGDYMHGRLMVPAAFAMVLPLMMAPIPEAAPSRSLEVVFGLAAAMLTIWVVLCATRLRVPVENMCNVGDERGWYAREAGTSNPIVLDAYRKHPFYDASLQWLQKLYGACPAPGEGGAPPPGQPAGGSNEGMAVPPCRRVFLEEGNPHMSPAPASAALAPGVDPRIGAVVPTGAIGMVGYFFDDRVHVVDVHGLAEPIAARFTLEVRGRPGHEKRLSAAWLFGRFAAPQVGEDPSVTAARHALQCGPLAALGHAVTAPLTFASFFDNVAHAWEYSRLRIPSEPLEAEARFCGTPLPTSRAAGGSGGTRFAWRCPPGEHLIGLRGRFDPKAGAVAQVRALCRAARSGGEPVSGPDFGEDTGDAFEVACPGGAGLDTLRGTADRWVRSVGVRCAGQPGRGPLSPSAAGDRAAPYELACPAGKAAVGVVGRYGSLIDALALMCEP